MEKCLGEKCKKNCCGRNFKGLANALINEKDDRFVQIRLDNNEKKRIIKIGREDLIETIDGKSYLKLNKDNSCIASVNGRCSIYENRPDVCKLYPFYFDPFCGICVDKNCEGSFVAKDADEKEFYKLIKNRIKMFMKD